MIMMWRRKRRTTTEEMKDEGNKNETVTVWPECHQGYSVTHIGNSP
jgi:hypothetical protein